MSAERRGGEAAIHVLDNGLGIPPDQLARIFEMFSQVDRSRECTQGGLGIGLNLVKRLVEMHGGSVVAYSAGPGCGSEFVVRLPILMLEPKAKMPAAPIQQPRATSRRILVVDDNQDAAASLAMLLQLAGNETQIAHDGLQAIETAAAFQPDVVLLDIGLPKLNGYDACRRIREQPWGKNMVFVALTGWGLEEDLRESKHAGFDHHLVKPVDFDVLKKLLAQQNEPEA